MVVKIMPQIIATKGKGLFRLTTEQIGDDDDDVNGNDDEIDRTTGPVS